jgi:hypothetical protein
LGDLDDPQLVGPVDDYAGGERKHEHRQGLRGRDEADDERAVRQL